jgi:Uma2 family endonuclease
VSNKNVRLHSYLRCVAHYLTPRRYERNEFRLIHFSRPLFLVTGLAVYSSFPYFWKKSPMHTVKLKQVGGFTDEMFYEFCQLNYDLKFERDRFGTIFVMEPTGAETGNFNVEVAADVTIWNRKHRKGVVFDSSAGFTLPNTAVRSPDVSWIAREKWEALSPDARKKFAPICPDFVIEIRSESDAISGLKAKMEEYMENGCRLGWLIDRHGQKVYIFRSGKPVEMTYSLDVVLSGEDVLPGFELNLKTPAADFS